MTRFFLFAALFFYSAISATEINIDIKDRDVKTVFYGCHSYVCFDNKFYIHDPQCRCDARWGSLTRDSDGKIISQTDYIRMPVSHYD